MQELTELKRTGPLVDVFLADHALFHLEADLRWIDLTSARLTELAEAVQHQRHIHSGAGLLQISKSGLPLRDSMHHKECHRSA